MAKRTCGATDRLDQTRVRRSCDRLRRATSASSAALVPAVLQRHPNTSVTGQRLTGAESRPCHREHSSVADPRRIASPLCPDLICDMDTSSGGGRRLPQSAPTLKNELVDIADRARRGEQAAQATESSAIP